MAIRLHNSATRAKQDFAPIDRSDVRMYVCGPTVYDRAHLGNARPVVVFDVLFRLLRHVYGAEAVTYVRNFTDVDDKINATAQARKAAGDARPLEGLIRERTEETIGWYHADMDALGALRPTVEPRATDYIGPMVTMIQGLIAGGHAYEKAGHVLFRVRSYKDYGRLSGRSVDDMIAGARVEVAPFKEDPMDFVLWKPSDADLPGWDSPWGRGRPGWHIECSAMSFELLGAEFDIHGGGLDLQFPHHENEIAQSCCAGHGFARLWMHNEMLQVEGKKMSKSLGNFFTVRDLLEKGVPGEVIRFVFLGTHYRKPMDWTAEKAAQAREELERWAGYSKSVGPQLPPGQVVSGFAPGFIEALSDDLNTPEALTSLRKFEKDHLRGKDIVERHHYETFTNSVALLLGLEDTQSEGREFLQHVFGIEMPKHAGVLRIIARIEEARANKDFATSDQLRDVLIGARFEVKITRNEVVVTPKPDSDYSKLESL